MPAYSSAWVHGVLLLVSNVSDLCHYAHSLETRTYFNAHYRRVAGIFGSSCFEVFFLTPSGFETQHILRLGCYIPPNYTPNPTGTNKRNLRKVLR